MKQNLLGAFVYNSLGIPIAAGILWPLTGTFILRNVAFEIASASATP